MTSKHTPGPWILFGQRSGDEWHAHAILPAGRPGSVAEFKEPPSEADAKLMAAAPDLYEFVCEIAHDGFSATHDGRDARPCLHCRAARLMCKAEGREP